MSERFVSVIYARIALYTLPFLSFYHTTFCVSLSPIRAPVPSLVFELFLGLQLNQFNFYCYLQCSHVLLQTSWYCSQSTNDDGYHSGFNLPETFNLISNFNLTLIAVNTAVPCRQESKD